MQQAGKNQTPQRDVVSLQDLRDTPPATLTAAPSQLTPGPSPDWGFSISPQMFLRNKELRSCSPSTHRRREHSELEMGDIWVPRWAWGQGGGDSYSFHLCFGLSSLMVSAALLLLCPLLSPVPTSAIRLVPVEPRLLTWAESPRHRCGMRQTRVPTGQPTCTHRC